METLPPEMLEKIVQDFTVKDLAHCSAVSRKWREAFNQDWLWEPHCDPELEESLQTIPCVATPAIVTPQDLTLTPLCHWRNAFLREAHLWRNWRCKGMKEIKKENIILPPIIPSFLFLLPSFFFTLLSRYSYRCWSVDFLTDTLVVAWCPNQIKILDVSVTPAAFVSEIDTSIEKSDICTVTESCKLLVTKKSSLEVFSVEMISKSICLQHMISFGYFIRKGIALGNIFFCITDCGSKLLIFDWQIGKKIKEEICLVEDQDIRYRFSQFVISQTSSDYMVVKSKVSENHYPPYKFYTYSLKQLIFLPKELPVYNPEYSIIALHESYVALNSFRSVMIFNCQTSEVVLYRRKGISRVEFEFCLFTDDYFIFLDSDTFGRFGVYMYSLSDASITNVCNYEREEFDHIQIINKKFIATFDHNNNVSKSVWEVSGRSVKKSDICILSDAKSNRSFTKVINKAVETQSTHTVKDIWYISHLW